MVKKLVFGKGVNDADYKISWYDENKKRKMCPYYVRWTDMLRRCYSQLQLSRFPCYTQTKVCEEWLTFSTFKSWMQSQDWKNKVLDKDILGDNNEYNPDSCVFVPEYVNLSFISLNKVKGVCFHKRSKVYQAGFSRFGKQFYIGSFSNEDEAISAYKKEKSKFLNEVLEKYLLEFSPDKRVINRLNEEIKRNE